MKAQVVIIGGGPSGLLLSQLLMLRGIDTVILEKHSEEHVLKRIRAGVIESGSINVLSEAEVSERISLEGQKHHGTMLTFGQKILRVNFSELIQQHVTVFGQTEITKDLYSAQKSINARIFHNVQNVSPNNILEAKSSVSFLTSSNVTKTIECDFIIGCDGFHGVSRTCIPDSQKNIYERTYPFGWLGILSETPPVHHELIYSNSKDGFALASMRSDSLSRYYIQCDPGTKPEEFSDSYFWDQLKRRLPEEFSSKLITGKSIEKSIAPLRSFVCEPIQWGNLFLVGDAAHIVPPTGAKGLNLAISDVYYLSNALKDYYSNNCRKLLNVYSETALKRIWKTVRFSWWMTHILHRFPESSEFERKIQATEFDNLLSSNSAQLNFAENYIGLPY